MELPRPAIPRTSVSRSRSTAQSDIADDPAQQGTILPRSDRFGSAVLRDSDLPASPHRDIGVDTIPTSAALLKGSEQRASKAGLPRTRAYRKHWCKPASRYGSATPPKRDLLRLDGRPAEVRLLCTLAARSQRPGLWAAGRP